MLSGEEQLKECRKANNVLGAAVFVLVIVSLLGLPIVYLAGKDAGRTGEQKQAAREGVGEYSFNRRTGEIEFSYVLPALPADALIDNNCWVIKKKYN